ncbi:MAG TPA: hypothetical protein VML19_18215 [Verrucomicrobiae bacterium]|nr:hypothetical protein [Verrucomicrobiae bacterium]
MKYWGLVAVTLLAVVAAGCVSHAKPAPPPPPVPVSAGDAAKSVPPSEPLSIPQTRIEPWPAQTLDLDALELEPQTVSPAPSTAPPAASPNAHRTIAPPVAPKPETPPPTVEPLPARPPIQEQLPEGTRNDLLEKAHNKQKAVRTWLDSTKSQRLAGEAKRKRDNIQRLLNASEEAERRADFTAAEQLADRAELFVREFQGGR